MNRLTSSAGFVVFGRSLQIVLDPVSHRRPTFRQMLISISKRRRNTT
jgi:hypothetical protein